jgi:hypothetical protein
MSLVTLEDYPADEDLTDPHQAFNSLTLNVSYVYK